MFMAYDKTRQKKKKKLERNEKQNEITSPNPGCNVQWMDCLK